MHSLKSNQEVRVVTVEIAVPADMEHAEITDGIGEMLRNAQTTEPDMFLDWGFNPIDIDDCPIMKMGKNPGEGEPFGMPRFCVIVGDPISGFEIHGPFHDEDMAIQWADTHIRTETWWTTELIQESQK